MTENLPSASVKGAPHADALAPGTRLAEFEILSLLGVGGFGVVYKAFDHSLHRTVAIKEYLPLALAGRHDELSVSVRTLSDEQAFQSGLKSFVGEARLLAQFDHPSLVKVFRFWEAHNTAYMVMPLYNGMTFKQARTQMRTPPSEAWLRQVLWSVLGALRTLHESRTLHRDISPDNIFLQDLGPPVLLDLGAARHAINDRDRKHTAVLKVNYAPIEQYADGDADLPQGPWSDLYSLAAVVHGCLCNDTPLPSTLRSIRDRMVPFARVAKTVRNQFGQEYSPTFVAAIAQSLALRPEDRPQSIDAFLQAMDMVSPPSSLGVFDFRAELGDIWVEPTDQPGPGFTGPTVDLTHALVGPLGGRLGPLGPSIFLTSSMPLGLGVPSLDIPAVCRSPQGVEAPSAFPSLGEATAVPVEPGFATASSALPSVARASLQGPHGEHSSGVAGPAQRAPTTGVASQEVPDNAFLERGDRLLLKGLALGHDGAGEGAAPSAAPASRPVPVPPGHAHRERKRSTWLAAATALSLVVAAALAYDWMARAPAQLPEDTIITEMAEPLTGAPSNMASAASAAVAPAAPKEAPGASPAPSAPAGPPPAFVEVSSTPAPARRATKAAAAPELGAVRATMASAAPAPPPKVAKPRPAPARELCADTNFFTRSACVYSECAKPVNATLPVCVDHHRRLQRQADSVSGN